VAGLTIFLLPAVDGLECQALGTVEKPLVVGTALVAVPTRVRTGIHPEGLILKDKPCPYIKTSPQNGFFNTP